METTAIKIAKALTSGKPWEATLESMAFFEGFFFQECLDLPQAFEKYTNEIHSYISATDKDEKGFSSFSNILTTLLFCRIIELLLEYGVESPEYQHLISQNIVRDVIRDQIQQVRLFDKRLFAKSRTVQNLFTEEFFFVDSISKTYLQNDLVLKECDDLLYAYINWWYNGEGLEEDKVLEEYDVVVDSFPYIFFSLLLVAIREPNRATISRILYKHAKLGASFTPIELWLERKAAMCVHQTSGLVTFLPFGERARPILIYYLLIKNKLNSKEKQLILEAIKQSGQIKVDEIEKYKEHLKRYPNYQFIEMAIYLELEQL